MGKHIELHDRQVQAIRDAYSMAKELKQRDPYQTVGRDESIKILNVMLNELLTEEELSG